MILKNIITVSINSKLNIFDEVKLERSEKSVENALIFEGILPINYELA